MQLVRYELEYVLHTGCLIAVTRGARRNVVDAIMCHNILHQAAYVSVLLEDVQEGLAVASIARDYPSPLPGMHLSLIHISEPTRPY